MLHTRFNRAFRSVFGLFQIIFQIIFASFVPKLHFFIKKEKALGDFQIIFQILFASFVLGLTDKTLSYSVSADWE